MVSYASMGQSSIIDSDKDYIGWSYISIEGKELTIEARDYTQSYATPNITLVFAYDFVKEIPEYYPPLELFGIYFMAGFYTHSPSSSQTKINVFRKAAEKYCKIMDDTLLGKDTIWSHTLKKCKEI